MAGTITPLLPGVVFDVTISDPKERVQAWLDAYKPSGEEIPHVRVTSHETSTCALMKCFSDLF